jgi:DNA-3-methyladenine glycosylase II
MTAPTPSAIKAACETLAASDRALALAYATSGVPKWRARKLDYALFAGLVTHQLISLQAAASIWARIQAHLGEVTAENMLAASENELRACGLSRPKITHMKSIARAVLGPLDLASLPRFSPDEARKSLLAVKGIGPWTAELVALYALGEMNAFPHGDVGLMESYKRLSAAETRLSSKAFSQLAEDWRPHRGVAAHLLWAWLHSDRARQKEARQTGKLS